MGGVNLLYNLLQKPNHSLIGESLILELYIQLCWGMMGAPTISGAEFDEYKFQQLNRTPHFCLSGVHHYLLKENTRKLLCFEMISAVLLVLIYYVIQTLHYYSVVIFCLWDF